jgi:FkbM family methyltransferase
MNPHLKRMLRSALPEPLFRKLARYKTAVVNDYARQSYSQEGEDLLLATLFGNIDRGFYVDVGAYHPKFLSNTYFFYRRGWSGINIEARPGSMAAFRRQRPRDINLEAAVGRDRRELSYFMFSESYLNTLDRDLAAQREREHNRQCRQVVMTTVPLADLLAQHVPREQAIHFLNVDVEGLDMDVLESNDWTTYRPQCVLVECLACGLADLQHDSKCRYLTSLGYAPFAKTPLTVLFKSIA